MATRIRDEIIGTCYVGYRKAPKCAGHWCWLCRDCGEGGLSDGRYLMIKIAKEHVCKI